MGRPFKYKGGWDQHLKELNEARKAGPKKPCDCGCGALIPVINSYWKPAGCALGHDARVHPERYKKPKLKQFFLNCKQCGKSFPTYLCGAKHFCSFRCYSLNRTGKPSPHRQTQSTKTTSVSGFRSDLGAYFRSRWEANYARILNYLNVKFAYEPQQFLVDFRDGTQSYYLPDFYLTDKKYYVEIKGWNKPGRRGLARIIAFQKQYKTRVKFIGSAQYFRLQKKYSSLIPNWEFGGKVSPTLAGDVVQRKQDSRPKHPCECGCGTLVFGRFVHAHNSSAGFRGAGFKKGNIPWNKGKKGIERRRELQRMRARRPKRGPHASVLGRLLAQQGKHWNKGRKHKLAHP